jgi:hypothetical protein
VPLRLPEAAHTREFRAFLERVPEIADSLAVDAVRCERLSCVNRLTVDKAVDT